MICPGPVRVYLSAWLDYILSEGGPRWETFHRWGNNLEGFARKLVNNIYCSFSNFTIFLKANNVVIVQIGNGVTSPGNYLAAGIVKKEERGEVWINRERKKEGRKGKRRTRPSVLWDTHSECKNMPIQSLAPTVFKEMIWSERSTYTQVSGKCLPISSSPVLALILKKKQLVKQTLNNVRKQFSIAIKCFYTWNRQMHCLYHELSF